ncbi:putative fatty acyl-CoA reductase CG5065 [Centruroides vittatus]|uniref:putative fatty acyl-CoA reductase CG5065 n=1 Tax=Centruroides vittatus TaxID=120091 RepID=UPI00350F2D90
MIDIDKNIGDVRDFYSGKSVFVTGGTGFVGKVLLEKLLRSCDLKNIYVLIRNKHGVDPNSRLRKVFDNKLYDRLKNEKPNFFDKVVCIPGDFNSENIGINSDDYRMLRNNVSVIFHIGATVRFDLTLKETLTHNLYPMKVLIDLAKNMTHLKAFVYVSTAYSNTHAKDVYEKVYSTDIPVKCVLDCMSWMDKDTFEVLKPKFLSRHPNNYCYSKCLAEQLLKEEEENLPVIIVRPPLITSTLKEPIEGWIDQYNLLVAFIISFGKGLIRIIPGNLITVNEYVPVDYCANMTIVSAWDKAKKGKGDITVYNCTSGNNERKDGELMNLVKIQKKYPFLNCYRYPSMIIIKNKILYSVFDFLFHLIPAIILDIFFTVFGKKAKMQFIYKKLWIRIIDSQFFLSNIWTFHADNSIKLLNSMTEEEKEIFDFDVRKIDYSKYLEKIVLNIKTNLLNESPSTIPMARNRAKKLFYVEAFCYVLAFGLFIIICLQLWKYVFNMLN